MSKMKSLLGSINISCPKCEEQTEIEDMDVSVCVEHHDIMRKHRESEFVLECQWCGAKSYVVADLDVSVSLIEKEKQYDIT